jgi:beta-glucuronidase
MLALADREGIIVISETAANTLSMKAVADLAKKAKLLAEHKRQITELMERDYNFASVLFWSLGNECETYYPEGDDYFPELVRHARTLDNSRPVTMVVNSARAEDERNAHLFDLLMLNTYPSWYVKCGKYEEIDGLLRPFLEGFHAKYKKPILVSEFGADTIPGLHSEYNLMWSEEFQFEMLRRVIDIAEEYPFVFGTHVWNLCDFRVGQHTGRIINNWKGVFTRDRTPKMAAHLLRERWKGQDGRRGATKGKGLVNES